MILNDKVMRRVPEIKYADQEVSWRYRSILRLLYIFHEQYRFRVSTEEIYEELREMDLFKDYQLETLEIDLRVLVESGNLTRHQDTVKAQTPEEFLRKKFLYQLTDYTVRFERMLIEFEESTEKIGSLHSSIIERFYEALRRLINDEIANPSDLYLVWSDLFEHFTNLHNGSSDFLSYLNSQRADEFYSTDTFLIYKDNLTDRLRNFIIVLQEYVHKIRDQFDRSDNGIIEGKLKLVATYQLEVPRPNDLSVDDLRDRHFERWLNLKGYFLTTGDRGNEVAQIFRATEDAIKNITYYAQRLGEKHQNSRSRQNEYLHLSKCFIEAESLDESHKLFASIFGVSSTRHIFATPKTTDNPNTSIWDQEPTVTITSPKNNSYKRRSKLNSIKSNAEEKRAAKLAYLEKQAEEQRIIEELLSQSPFELANIPYKTRFVRDTILDWISKCMVNDKKTCQTETGKWLRMQMDNSKRIVIDFEDGELEMPDIKFWVFLSGKEDKHVG